MSRIALEAEEETCRRHENDATRVCVAPEEAVASALEWALEELPHELLALYEGDLSFLDRFAAGVALSMHGIAPRDRALTINFSDRCRYCVASLAVADVVWLAARYPDHEPRDARLRPVFDLNEAPVSAALLVLHCADTGVDALALTEEQLDECVFLSQLHGAGGLPMAGSRDR